MREDIRGRAYLVKLLGFTGKIRQVLSFSFPPLPSSFFFLPSSFFLLPSSLSFFKETNDFTDIIEDLTIGGKLRDRVYGVSG